MAQNLANVDVFLKNPGILLGITRSVYRIAVKHLIGGF